MSKYFNFSDKLHIHAEKALSMCKHEFERINEISEYNSHKVLKSFINNKVSDIHLRGTTGYGYGDSGRETLDAVYADTFGAEDALVRHTMVSGTHAIITALFGLLRPGDIILSVTGKPYDTLLDPISKKGIGSLSDFGIIYNQIDLMPDGGVDYNKIRENSDKCKIVYIQRSRGYSLRSPINVDDIKKIVDMVKAISKDTIVIVDNCYGEFVQTAEPTNVGADVVIGSLIKNPGGGIAENGGYIAGRRDLIELCAYRNTVPGIGKEIGAGLNQLRGMFMGLYYAPEVVANALKTAAFASALFGLIGYECTPRFDEKRSDIVNAIILGSERKLTAFCEGIQKASPIDSFVMPEPWNMPGYDNKVVMAAGAFTMGSSIELSADAPIREPYAVYMQGGVNFHMGKLGVMLAAQAMDDQGLLFL